MREIKPHLEIKQEVCIQVPLFGPRWEELRYAWPSLVSPQGSHPLGLATCFSS